MNPCILAETLELLLADGLDDPEAQRLRDHLGHCLPCQQRLDLLSDHPGLRGLLAECRLTPTTAIDPELGHFLARLREIPFPELPPVHADPRSSTPFAFLGPPEQEGNLGTLGPYRFLAELGRGGMGVVFKALDPLLGRTLAVKVMWPERARARFSREARAAAVVQHDHIVPVYAVADPLDGPPYLAMQYVPGPTLRERIREARRLDPKEVARIACQVADGLAAAHQAGLVHRDVKSANILLDAVQGRARITDFGLVHLLEGEGSTVTGTLRGTPEYMCPEQIREPERIDGRTDVYSLGVTLYEALTGEVPFRGVPPMVLQKVLADEPIPPRRLNDQVPRDLETICLKAMSKEPERRYATAADLRDDLARWQRGEPIRARPVGRLGRLWRWCRRNPGLASLTAALVLALLTGVGGIAWQWRRAEVKAAEPSAKADEADRQRLHARRDFRRARDAVNKYLTEVSEDPELKARNLEPLRRRLLRTARDYYETFVREHPGDLDLQAELGQAYGRLGAINALLDAPPASLPMYQKKRAIFERLHHRYPEEAAYQNELADSCWRLGFGYHCAGEGVKAWDAFRQARDLWTDLTRKYPDEPEYSARLIRTFNSLGRSYDINSRKPEAERVYKEGQAAYACWVRRHPADAQHQESYAWLLSNLGSLYRTTGRAEAAVAPLRQAVTLGRQLVKTRPQQTAGKEVLYHALAELAATHYTRADADAAEAAAKEDQQLAEELAHDHPGNPDYQEAVAVAYCWRAMVLFDLRHRPAEAAPLFQKVLRIREQLVRGYPASVPYFSNLFDSYEQLVWTFRARGDLPAALQLCTRAIAGHKPARPLGQIQEGDRMILTFLYVHRADILHQLKRYADALADQERAVQLSPATKRQRQKDLRELAACHVRLAKEEHAQAAAAARAVANRSRGDGSRLYRAAAVLSHCTAEALRDERLPGTVRQRLAEEYAAEAVSLLCQARKAGYFQLSRFRAALETDGDFQPLRSRPDFQKLVAEL